METQVEWLAALDELNAAREEEVRAQRKRAALERREGEFAASMVKFYPSGTLLKVGERYVTVDGDGVREVRLS